VEANDPRRIPKIQLKRRPRSRGGSKPSWSDPPGSQGDHFDPFGLRPQLTKTTIKSRIPTKGHRGGGQAFGAVYFRPVSFPTRPSTSSTRRGPASACRVWKFRRKSGRSNWEINEVIKEKRKGRRAPGIRKSRKTARQTGKLKEALLEKKSALAQKSKAEERLLVDESHHR